MKKNLRRLLILSLGFAGIAQGAAPLAKNDRASRAYRVQKGETLSHVSLRLLGDAHGWKSLWNANRKWISDPHSVREGTLIYFTPGDQSHLPGLQTLEPRAIRTVGFTREPSESLGALRRSSPTIEDVLSLSSAAATRSDISSKVAETSPDGSPSKSPQYPWGDELSPGKAEEWKNLPHQNWENIEVKKPSAAKVDPLGFDRSNRVTFHEPKGLEPQFWAATNEIPSAGEVTASPAIGKNLVIGEVIQIAADTDLALGEVYSIMHESLRLKGFHADTYGHAYPVAGKVKVIGNGDQGYLAVVLHAMDVIERGDLLIADIARLPELEPVAGPSEIEAKLLADPRRREDFVAQHQFAFIDRGSADGIKTGMIFRKYADRDPVNSDSLNRSDFMVVGDVMVMQVSEKYSLVKVIMSRDVLKDEDDLFLITDISSFRRVRSKVSYGEDEDDLDRLDDGRNLNPSEAQELQQLETAPATGPGTKESAPEFDAPEGDAPDFEAPPSNNAPNNGATDETAPPEFDSPNADVLPPPP